MGGKISGGAIGAFVTAVVLTLIGLGADDWGVSAIIVPLVFLLILYVMTQVPVRVSLLAMMFCAFTLENPSEIPSAGRWASPFYPVGAMLLAHLNIATGIKALSFSGMDIFIVALFLIALQRRKSGSKIDSAGRVPTPKPLVQLAQLSLLGTAFVWVVGMVRGGEFSSSLWQIDRVMYLPLIFLLAQYGLRCPKDLIAVTRIVLIAPVYKACTAVYVMQTVQMPCADPETGSFALPYATTHHDSILFALATVLIVALVLYRVGKRPRFWALIILPILVAGMLNNGRRMVFVQIGLVFVTLYFATPINAVKRKVKRYAIILSPVVAIYMVAGWSSHAGIFKPVQTVRSVVDPQTDASSMTREIENYDIIYTLKQYPVLGSGYGIPYWEMIPLPPLGYALERYAPHNSILGLWCYSGYFGYTAMTLLWAAGVYFGMRAYHVAKEPAFRAAALVSFGSVLIYLIQCFGDMGLGSWIGVFTVAPSVAMAGKLCVAAGAWPAKAPAARQAARAPSAQPQVGVASVGPG